MRETGWQRREVLAAGVAAACASGSGWARVPGVGEGADTSDLLRVFGTPPLHARPGCYWYWMGGAVTDEGITRDLEEMQKAGIGTAVLFSIGKAGDHPLVTPPADALTPTWWARVEHAAREAQRLGLELAFNACDGWATAAGPWITPELSMQHLVWTERFVDGGKVDLVAQAPAAMRDYYRDIATLALPLGRGWEETSATRRARVSTDLPVTDLAKLADPANAEQVVDTERGGWVQFAFDAPFTLRSVTVRTAHATSGFAPGVYRAANSLWVEASDDGEQFRPVGRLDYPEHGWQTDMTTLTHALPPTTARIFRLVHRPEGPFGYEEERDFGQDIALKLSSLTLSAMPAVQSLPVKNGEQWGRARRMTAADLPADACTPRAAVIDLSQRMAADGRIRTDLPAGRWRILRIGYTSTGKGNSAAGAGQGLECSRFEREAVERQYDGWFALVRQRLGTAGRAIAALHVDSWEAGTQNWSPSYAEAFQARRGYDVRAWLPVLCGVPIDSADATERVLWDQRRTVADLARDIFYGTLSERTRRDGVRFSGEPASPTFPVDGLDYARFLDMPMGEFWYNTPRNDKPNDIKDAVSGGRIYGRSVIGAEAFTEGLMDWTEQPAKWKPLGDHIWCEGVNRFMLHVWAGQPFPDRGPGMTLNGIGSQMNYLQSWWRPGKSWFDYLGRGQALLQQGRVVADIAYFIGEDVPTRALLPRQLRPALPAGYAYDSINRDALIRLARVEQGWIVLPGGARYRLLVLPPGDRMTAELALRLEALVEAGATVCGPRPVAAPGLGRDDIEVRRVAAALWDSGRVKDHADLAPLLARLSLGPDLLCAAPGIEWTHRQGPGWDLYFVSNQQAEAREVPLALRSANGSPELWDAVRGTRRPLAGWAATPQGMRGTVRLDPHGSAFLLFARGARAPAAPLPLKQRVAATVEGPWLVRFADHLPASRSLSLAKLSSWTEQTDPDIRFYSGVATYSAALDVPASRRGERVLLDLGRVESLATLRVNGRDAGSLFQPPFLFDITALVRPGRNRIEVDVANTWRNRLIGDAGKPDAERASFVVPILRKNKPWLPGGPGVEPDPAGLFGPVRLLLRSGGDGAL